MIALCLAMVRWVDRSGGTTAQRGGIESRRPAASSARRHLVGEQLMSQPGSPERPTSQNPRDAKAQVKAEKAYRKAQRPWYQKKRFILPLGLLVLIVLIVALTSGGDEDPTVVSPGGSGAQAPAGGPPAFPGATEDDVVAQAGDTVDADGVQITAAALTPGDATIGETLCTTVTYNNQSDQPSAFNGGFDWKLQGPSGAILSPTITGSDNLLSAGELAPGGNTTGDVCFDAPQGTPSGQYVVLLDPTFSFSSDRIAWLNTL
jgi:hypothetical protein